MPDFRKPKSWLKSVSAFANGLGGKLIFGVDDDDTLVGIEDAKDVSEKISENIKDKMDPVPQVDLQRLVLKAEQRSWDSLPSGYAKKDFSFRSCSRMRWILG